MSRFLRAAAAAALLAVALLPAPAAAAEATFQAPTASATFGEGVTFAQAFTSPVPLARAEVLLDFPDSLGPYVAEAGTATSAGDHLLTYRWSVSEGGYIAPNTPITARWRLVPQDRSLPAMTGPPVRVVYQDTRFEWRTVEGDLVRVHWYRGSDAFGKRVLQVAEKAITDAETFLGVTETEPIDFFVYATESDFREALGPSTRENVGAEQHADIRTMFAWIGPGDRTVAIYVSHELTHLVFDTAVDNPYHFPPRWFNEGVAVYLTEGYAMSERELVKGAVADGRLRPLTALGGMFPTTFEGFYLAYAESVSAVDFLVRENGTDALVELINSYADGVTDDEAFRAATGLDVAGFEAAWLADLGADTPARLGPLPPPAGPLPPGWEQAVASPSPGAASPEPGGSPSPGAGASASAAPGEPGEGGSSSPDGALFVVAALAGLAVGGSIGWVRRRRTSAASGGAAGGPPSPAGETFDAPPTSSGPEP